MRKQVAELLAAKNSSEQITTDLQRMLDSSQSQRDSLQREVVSLQGQLSQEKSAHSHAAELQKELEGDYFKVFLSFFLFF